MHCPTIDEITAATLALLPRGRAWQNNEGGPMPGYDAAFAPSGFQNNAFATSSKAKSILWHYWRSYAQVMHYLTTRLCELREEFWCSTINETRPEWMIEYGLPDECDPFPDLCTKVTAIGGTRCDYYAEVAARVGWKIECDERNVFCGSRTGRRMLSGRARTGRVSNPSQLRLVVYLNESPAYSGELGKPALSGRFRSGRRPTCGPPLTPLKCLMSRVVHAEIQITYEGKNGS